jgi:hypothetical protein
MEFLQIFSGPALKGLLNNSAYSIIRVLSCLDYQPKIPETDYKITRLPLFHGL